MEVLERIGKVKLICPDLIGFFPKLIRTWNKLGFDAQLFNCISDNEYHKAGTSLSRLALRWKINIGFLFTVVRYLSNLPADSEEILILANTPFLLPALAEAFRRGKKYRTIHLVYDLYPEVLIYANLIKPRGWLSRRIASLTAYSLKKCTASVFFGEQIKRYIESTYGSLALSAAIPVGSDGDPFTSTTPQPLQKEEIRKILYSGTMGYMHEINTLLSLFERGIPDNVKFLFHSSGAGYFNLKRLMNGLSRDLSENVLLGSTLRDEDWFPTMLTSHVGLVTMIEGAQRVCMPSKTYSAMLAGQAILGICPKDSDLAQTILLHDCGWIVEPGDSNRLLEVIDLISTDSELLDLKRNNSYRAGHKFYEIEEVGKQWAELFYEVLKKN